MLDHTVPCDLIFVAGPNARDPAGRAMMAGFWSSMRRTANPKTFGVETYDFFRDCIKATIRAALLAMIQQKNNIAIIGGVSTGLYAGVHFSKINSTENGFESCITEVLEEPVKEGCNIKIGQFFYEVIYPLLPQKTDSERSPYARASSNSRRSFAQIPPNSGHLFLNPENSRPSMNSSQGSSLPFGSSSGRPSMGKMPRRFGRKDTK